MKLLALAGGLALLLTVGVLSYLAGAAFTLRSEAVKMLRQSGLTRNGAELLGEAMALLNSLVRLTKLDGDFGDTRLSDKDTQRVKDLVCQYRKETNKA